MILKKICGLGLNVGPLSLTKNSLVKSTKYNKCKYKINYLEKNIWHNEYLWNDIKKENTSLSVGTNVFMYTHIKQIHKGPKGPCLQWPLSGSEPGLQFCPIFGGLFSEQCSHRRWTNAISSTRLLKWWFQDICEPNIILPPKDIAGAADVTP